MKLRQIPTALITLGGQTLREVTIEKTSVRKFTLMKEDYIRLDFTLDHAVTFPIGCEVEDELFGRFVMRTEQMPTLDTKTFGYNYKLQFDRPYIHLEDSLYMLTNQKYDAETKSMIPVRESVEFSLTFDLYGQINTWLTCAEAVGFPVKFDASIDTNFPIGGKSPYMVELMQFSKKGMLSALKDICDKWECEYWFIERQDGLHLCLGKCEGTGEPLDLQMGVNVDSMSISNNRNTYANRIYAYGGKENIATDYRKSITNYLASWCNATLIGVTFNVFTLARYRNDYMTSAFNDSLKVNVSQTSFIQNKGDKLLVDYDNTLNWAVSVGARMSAVTDYELDWTEPYVDYQAKAKFDLIKTNNGTDSTLGAVTIIYTGKAKRNQSYYMYWLDGNTSQYPDADVTDFNIEEKLREGHVINRREVNAATSQYSFDTEFITSATIRYTGSVTGKVKLKNSKIDNVFNPYTLTRGQNQYNGIGDVSGTIECSFMCEEAVRSINVYKETTTGIEKKVIFAKFYNNINGITGAFIPSGYPEDYKSNIVVFSSRPHVEWDSQHSDSEDYFSKRESGKEPVLYNVTDLIGWMYTDKNGEYYGDILGAKTFTIDSEATDLPSRVYEQITDDPSSLLRLGENRLRMPEGTNDYVQTEEAADPLRRIEKCVIFDKIYPRLQLEVRAIKAILRDEEVVYEGEENIGHREWTQYYLQLGFIDSYTLTKSNFSSSYLIDNETLKLKFVTPRDFNKPESSYTGKCLLAGMEFELEWMPDGDYDEEAQAFFTNGCFKVLRNDTYGAKLPNDALTPQTGDLCTFLSINLRKFKKTAMYTTSEEELEAKASEYLSALTAGQLTFDCVIMSSYMRNMALSADEGMAGQREFAMWLPSPASTNIGYLCEGRKVRILHGAIPSKVWINPTTSTILASEFVNGKASSHTFDLETGHRVSFQCANPLVLYDADGNAIAEGTNLVFDNQRGYTMEGLYVGYKISEGRLLAEDLDEYYSDNLQKSQWIPNVDIPTPLGCTITLTSEDNQAVLSIWGYNANNEDVDVAYGSSPISYTNTGAYGDILFIGTENVACNFNYYVMPDIEDVTMTTEEYIGGKESRVIGYELKLDIPFDTPRYTIGDTEAYSRLAKIERELQNR